MAKFNGYWPRLEQDYSGRNNPGTASGTAYAPGKIRTSKYFNGTSSDYVSFGTAVAIAEKSTIMFWIKFVDFTTGINGTYLNIISKRDPDTAGTTGRMILRYAPGTSDFNFYFYETTTAYFKSFHLPKELVVNRWYHVAVRFDVKNTGNANRLFLDGLEIEPTTDQTMPGTWVEAPAINLRAGYTANSASSYKGWMEDLAILPSLVSATEIQNYVSAINRGPKPNPIIDPSLIPPDYDVAETASATDAIEYYQPTKWRALTETAVASDEVVARNTTQHLSLIESATAADVVDVIEQLKKKEIGESAHASDTVEARNTTHHASISESAAASDALAKSATTNPALFESASASDLLDGRETLVPEISETAHATDAVAFTHTYSSTPQTGNYKLYLNGQIFATVFQRARQDYDCTEKVFGTPSRLQYNVWESLWPSTRQFYTIDHPKVRPVVRISYDLTAPVIFRQAWGGGLQSFSYNIYETTGMLSRQFNSITERTRIDLASRMYYQVRSNDLFTDQVQYDRYVYLNGADVTSKIKNLQITSSLSQYTAECSITWLDPMMYTELDPLNGMGSLRIEVYTGHKGGALVRQGQFMIEKRSVEIDNAKAYPTTWGRTVTARLASPHSVPITKGWDLDTHALTIALDVIAMSGSGVELLWQVADYRVLGGNFSATSEEPITLISRLAEPLGAIVTTNKQGQLVVRYQYV